jgi:hypothetical protein
MEMRQEIYLKFARDIIETKSIAMKFLKKTNLKNTISKSITTKFYKKKKQTSKTSNL